MIKLIVAISNNRIIGDSNKLIWNLPADLKRFKQITTDNTIVMGRKTYESIGKPLPNRRNIIITRNLEYEVDDCEIVSSLEEALLLTGGDCFIIGGGEIYKMIIDSNYLNEMFITYIDGVFDADTFFPNFNENEWTSEMIDEQPRDEKHSNAFKIIHYYRK
jgi:dihydrofolate reductase